MSTVDPVPVLLVLLDEALLTADKHKKLSAMYGNILAILPKEEHWCDFRSKKQCEQLVLLGIHCES